MVTVLMAILIFLGIGWQFAFEQWGIATTGTNTNLVHLPVTMQNLQYAVLVQNKGTLNYNGFWQVSDCTVNDFRIYNSMPGNGITWFWECIGK